LAVGLYMISKGQHTFGDLTNLLKMLIAIMVGIIAFPLTLYSSALLLKQDALNAKLVGDTRTDLARFPLLFLSLSLLLVIFSFMLLRQIGGQFAWFAVGTVGGILIDIARRSGNRARLLFSRLLSRNKIDPETAMPKGQLLPQLLVDTINVQSPSLFNASIFSETDAHVFISYTRSPDWSSSWARKLYSELRKADIECFLDSFSIHEGSCWRKTLNQRISESNVFIALMENATLRSEWVAAELEAALKSTKLTGAPDIFILTHPGLQFEDNQPCWQVFEAFLKRRVIPPKGPRLMKLEEMTIKVLVNELRTYRFHLTNALVPRGVDVVLRGMALLPMGILLLVGSTGTIFGWIAIASVFLQATGIADVREFLLFYGFLPPAYLLCGFWAGFVGRLAIASEFEVRLSQKKRVSKVHGLMAACYLILLMQWFAMVQPLIAAWGIVLGGIGWVLGNSFIFHIGQRKPEIRRDVK
jgi:hypothetical protein